jgi:hypothetical protein
MQWLSAPIKKAIQWRFEGVVYQRLSAAQNIKQGLFDVINIHINTCLPGSLGMKG